MGKEGHSMAKVVAGETRLGPRLNESMSRRSQPLIEWARKIRVDIIEMCYGVETSIRKAHPGAALSVVEILTALYFDIMRVDPENPEWPDRDRFILSKGHGAPVLYAALANRGYFDKSLYRTLRRVDGKLQGHPCMQKTPGVDMTTGSLGHGLAAGAGISLAGKIDQKAFQVFVLLGDGELQEGLVWESAMVASHLGLNNLTAIVDVNRLQSGFSVNDSLPLRSMRDKWAGFGWNVIEVDGHAMTEVLSALDLALAPREAPTVILSRTIKGRGVSFMENDNSWHQRTPSEQEYRSAIEELEAGQEGGVAHE